MITQSYYDVNREAVFADMRLGAEEWYSIDCSTYLTNENDTLVSATWTVPTGLTEMDSQVVSDVAFIKLRADIIGVHYIGFSLDSQESTNTQDTRERIKIEVLQFV